MLSDAALAIVVYCLYTEKDKYGLESGLKEMKLDFPLSSISGLNKMCSDPMPKNTEDRYIEDTSNATDSVDGKDRRLHIYVVNGYENEWLYHSLCMTSGFVSSLNIPT